MSAPWLFITVSDESAASREHLEALVASLERQRVAGDHERRLRATAYLHTAVDAIALGVDRNA